MKPALMAALMCAFFWASTLYLVPESSAFSLNNVNAMLGKSARIATESLDGVLSPAQANSYTGTGAETSPVSSQPAAKLKGGGNVHGAALGVISSIRRSGKIRRRPAQGPKTVEE
jgi:hypothetical protein